MKLKNKVIVITGGSSGIGSQIAIDSINQGAIVCIYGRNENRIGKFIKELNNKNIFGYKCDITNQEEVQKISKAIYSRFGKIDGLVNNAGINPSRNNVINTSLDDWNQTIDVNLTGAFICSNAILPLMLNSKNGSIVNISSIAGINALENRAAYMSSKWGLMGLASSLAVDFSPKNIRINTICPGYVKTPLVDKYLKSLSKREKDSLISSHLLGRLGKPKDISKCATFLLSEEASWITGVVIPVDGGFTASRSKGYN